MEKKMADMQNKDKEIIDWNELINDCYDRETQKIFKDNFDKSLKELNDDWLANKIINIFDF